MFRSEETQKTTFAASASAAQPKSATLPDPFLRLFFNKVDAFGGIDSLSYILTHFKWFLYSCPPLPSPNIGHKCGCFRRQGLACFGGKKLIKTELLFKKCFLK